MISFRLLSELAYEGNVGFHELILFYQKASDDEKDELDHLFAEESLDEAVSLIERVTGVTLHKHDRTIEHPVHIDDE
jgi:hypothetical protein